MWGSSDLDPVLGKGNEFKPLNKFKLVGVDDLPIEKNTYSYYIDIVLSGNRADEIFSSTYIIPISDAVGNSLNLGCGALLVINGYPFGIILVRKISHLLIAWQK